MRNASQWDRDSGLVFNERIVRQSRSDRKVIEHATAGKPPRYVPLTKGTQTLREIAQRCLLRHLHMLDEVSLSGVSEGSLASVWKVIVYSKLDSLHVWKLFVASCVGRTLLQKTWTVDQEQFRQYTFASIIRPLSILPADWITHLTVKTSLLSNSEVVSISSVSGLQSLHLDGEVTPIGATYRSLTDRTFLSWQALAIEGKAFTRLRSILMRGYPELCHRTLHCLADFPVLSELSTYRCGAREWPQLRCHLWQKQLSSEAFAVCTKAATGAGLKADRPQPRTTWSQVVDEWSSQAREHSPIDQPKLDARLGHPPEHLPKRDQQVELDRIVSFRRSSDRHARCELDKAADQQVERHPAKKRRLLDQSHASSGMFDSM